MFALVSAARNAALVAYRRQVEGRLLGPAYLELMFTFAKTTGFLEPAVKLGTRF